MEKEDKAELYSGDLSKQLFFIDSETYAALKANNMTVDEFADLIFSISKGLSISGNSHDVISPWQSSLTDNAKGVIAKLLKISSRDLSCMLSKNYLYYKMLNLVASESDDIVELLSDRWFYNIGILKSADAISIDKNYNVDLSLLEEYQNYSTNSLFNSRDKRAFKNADGVVYLLSAEDIKLLSLADKETINYFYEDMLKLFSIILKDETLYSSDLFSKYLDI